MELHNVFVDKALGVRVGYFLQRVIKATAVILCHSNVDLYGTCVVASKDRSKCYSYSRTGVGVCVGAIQIYIILTGYDPRPKNIWSCSTETPAHVLKSSYVVVYTLPQFPTDQNHRAGRNLWQQIHHSRTGFQNVSGHLYGT